MGQVYAMLEAGSQKLAKLFATTLDQVKSAMGINYFK